VNPKNIKLSPRTDGKKILNLEMTHLLRNQQGESIVRDLKIGQFFNPKILSSVILNNTIITLPAFLDLTIQIKNTDDNTVGFQKENIEIRDFSVSDLLISDVIFYTPEITTTNTVKEVVNGAKVELYPTTYISKDIPLMFYYEVYNMVVRENSSFYDVEFKLTEDRSKDSGFRKLRSKLSGSQKTVHSVKNQLVATKTDTKELIGFDLKDIKKGNYILTITVTAIWDKNVSTSLQKRLILK